MKRILAAFIMAILIHATLLAMGTKWLLHQKSVAPRTRITTVRLVVRPLTQIHPLPDAPLPLPPKPEPPPPPKPPVQKPVVQPKPLPKKPEKIVTPPRPTPPPVVVSPEPEPLPESPALRGEKISADSNTKPVPARSAPLSPTVPAPPDTDTTVVLAKPRYSQNPPPDYPSIARRRRYQGTVILEVYVLEDGQVGDLRVAESSNYSLLDRAAMKAVRRWQFDPARKGNREVAMWVKVPIRFNLK
ncbi:hypothetical protein DSCW_15810 [Desulfosarcina widdelii]|uniref:TonB C-terminal domain-containing protein n=1 Tax=Desulfosarcina widdelii TaxID=947919 RepID=A0A5K7Z6T0_9BACT|nr:energy transducer TonB [Desulfosarcina widdelii]BBO74164.1 hypothetical protein DSCW_15810 [Desulfosarcina widdelii]